MNLIRIAQEFFVAKLAKRFNTGCQGVLMPAYAAYCESDFLFDLVAEDKAEALLLAKQVHPSTTRVEPISEETDDSH